MKYKIRLAAVALAAAFCLTNALPAHADTKIAVVDMERVFHDSKAGQAAQRQLLAAQKTAQDDVNKQQQALQSTKDQLTKQQATAKPGDDFAGKVADYQKRVIDFDQQTKKKDAELKKSELAAVDKLRGQAGQIIGDIAQKDKIDFVLARQAVLLGDKSMDITDRVIAGLDGQTGGAPTASAKAAAAVTPAAAPAATPATTH